MPSEREIQLAFALKWALGNLKDSLDSKEEVIKLRAGLFDLADEVLTEFKEENSAKNWRGK